MRKHIQIVFTTHLELDGIKMNDNLCGAKFSLNLWVEKQKEASVCETLKFFDTKVECKI